MPRALIPIIIIVLVVIGGLFLLSTLPHQQPTHTVEVAVPQGGNAH
jgi:hypothetical protein